tara:strand:- start:1875 stop:2915 length:1041 start_codon:yes stop_codon:yes gene_type:complete
MKRNNKIAIIGGNISGLYSAIKYIDSGFNINIYEKKNYINIDSFDNYIYSLYNDNHTIYINLLQKFEIKSIKLNDITFNDKLYDIFNIVIEKSKLIPNNVLLTYTFFNLCKTCLKQNDIDIIKNYFNNCDIINNINAIDFIYIINKDLTSNTNYYYVTNDNINLLIKRMIAYIDNKNKIYYNNNVKTIKYNTNNSTNKFIINDNKSILYDYIICTISKDNLLAFDFWNYKQISLLNNVTNVNSSNVKTMIDKLINFNINQTKLDNNEKIRYKLLSDFNIVYPIGNNKLKNICFWNIGCNNVIIRDRIKNIYNNKFLISSDSFTINNMFINYSLDNIDNNILKIKKK